MPPSEDTRGSTLDDVCRTDENRVAPWIRRVVVLALVAVLVAAGSGRMGVRSGTTTAAARGWSLTVEYASVARAGLDVPLRLTVERRVPLGDELTIAVSRNYLNMFEQQGFYPDVSSTTALGDDVVLTFDVPTGASSLTVDMDGYVQPADQTGRSGTIAVLDGRSRVVEASIHTALFP